MEPTAEEHLREAAQAEYFAMHTDAKDIESIEGLNRQRDRHMQAAQSIMEEQGLQSSGPLVERWFKIYIPGE